MPKNRACLYFGVLLLLLTPVAAFAAGGRGVEKALRDRLGGYLEAGGGAGERRQLAAAIEADPAYRPERLSELLHGLPLWQQLPPGRHEIEIKVGFGHLRKITFRVPRGYDPARKWPLILAYHSAGSTGPSMLLHVAELLGPAADDFVIAAPTNYRQTSIDAPPPFSPEPVATLREIKKVFHLDSDRIYATGYSLGGYMSWALAVLYPDQLAGAMPMASTISVPGDLEGGWRQLSRNFAHLPILHVWGTADGLNVSGFEGRNQFAGTMASFNEAFSSLIGELSLSTVTENRVAGAGHGGARPRPESQRQLLAAQRQRWPKKVQHQFRHIHQGSAYWLEAHEWQGEGWHDFGRDLERQKGESWPQAFGRIYLPLLAELRGEVKGQKIEIETRHVADLTVWLSPELIDLGRPIEIELNGKKVFAGKVEPDLAVALDQAAITRDFDRLRWAGIRIDAAGTVKVVDAATVFPPLIRTP